ncbi:MAG: MarR family transcriptional regulator [Planctomycetes bacterium]|nr:MarR family transcriptional regulator [Planctomycetota bacterium]
MPNSNRPKRQDGGKAASAASTVALESSPGPEMMPATSADEDPIFEEIYNHGGVTVAQLRARLAKQGVKRSAKDIEASLRSLRKKGWVARSNWEWHLTTRAIQYMR